MKFGKKSRMCSHKFNGFTVDVYFDEKNPRKCYAEIKTDSGIMTASFGAGHPAYGFLVGCAAEKDWDAMEAYVYLDYSVSTFLCLDKQFADEVVESVNAHAARIEKEAEEFAESVTELQEIQADAEMRDYIDYANMTDKERKARIENMRNEFANTIDEFAKTVKKV